MTPVETSVVDDAVEGENAIVLGDPLTDLTEVVAPSDLPFSDLPLPLSTNRSAFLASSALQIDKSSPFLEKRLGRSQAADQNTDHRSPHWCELSGTYVQSV